MSDKAKRAIITVAGIEVEVIQLTGGEYVISQSQMSSATNENEINSRRFLKKKGIKPLLGKGFTADTFHIGREDESIGGSSRFTPIPINNAFKYWSERAFKGNLKAQALVIACGEETLHRRCDNAFEIIKTEAQYEQQTLSAYEEYRQSNTIKIPTTSR